LNVFEVNDIHATFEMAIGVKCLTSFMLL